ncbi:molybdate ABC transporter substrate-binding protein [Vibrio sp. 404]|uniref:Molybdate ABC transporter substrate-binding protein n=2 Tax=Vibrio marinisediminis TaxID=2758441 RepID=A0A7W2IV41_9VIBR|nr:molybdate ABC transporter substrate-binding protein [Vibrio marinisediminis]
MVVFSQISFAQDASSQQTIRVYAASSLTNALNELITQYENTHDVDIVAIYGGSSSLARQVEQGAPADLFISANELWVKHLERQGVAKQEDIHIFSQNRLVVIAPKGTVGELDITQQSSWLNMLKDSRLAIGQPNAVPAGIYAKQSLESLGVWAGLSKHLAPTSNVRISLTLVERGEAALGIVYQSDVMVSEKVRVMHTFDEASHDPIRYPLVQLTASQSVTQFMQFLLSESASKTLVEYGFN